METTKEKLEEKKQQILKDLKNRVKISDNNIDWIGECIDDFISDELAYKIYTKKNLADTSRDPDKYIYEDLGYKNNLDDAVKMATDYIQKRFFHKDTKLKKGKGNIIFTASDFCSYGAEIIIENNEENEI